MQTKASDKETDVLEMAVWLLINVFRTTLLSTHYCKDVDLVCSGR